MLPNGVDAVATLFGVWRAGARVRADQPPAHRRRRGRRASCVAGRPAPAAVVVDGDGRRGPRPSAARRSTPTSRWCQFTSGTTGRPEAGAAHATRACVTLLDGVIAQAPAAASRPRPADRPRRCPTSSRCRCRCGPASTTCCSPCGSARRSWSWTASTRPSSPRWCERFGIRSTVLPPAAMAMLVDDERGHRPRPAALRPQHHRAAVAAAGPPLPRPLRHRRPQLLRPDRDRRRDHRLERGRLAGPRRRQARRRSAGPTPGSRCASMPGRRRAASCRCAPRRMSRGLRRRRRPRRPAHRRRLVPHRRLGRIDDDGLRVDRGPGVAT